MPNENNPDKNVISAFYGSKAFVKIKQCLDIGKIQFSFVSLQDSGKNIDCYMQAEEFGALLMADVRNGSFFRKLAEEKSKGKQYPGAIWTSPMGGNATGNKGKPISRFFTISPGSIQEVLITANTYPACQNDKGAFIPEKGASPLVQLNVGCSMNDIRVLQYKWSFLERDYMTKKYCMENMKSDYQYNNHNAADDKPEENANQAASTNTTAFPDKDNASLKKMEISTLTLLQEYGSRGNLCFKAADRKNNQYSMIVEANVINELDKKKWQDFKSQAESATGIRQTFMVLPYGDRYCIKRFA